MPKTVKTLSVRVKDKHAPFLRQLAFEANQIWNAANEISSQLTSIAIPDVGYIYGNTSSYDIQKDLLAFRKDRAPNLPSHSYQEVIAAHAKARKQFHKKKLRWRISSGTDHSLGWIPFKVGSAVWKDGQVRFAGQYFKVWDSYGLSQYEFRAGSFSEDSRGRWYFNVTVEVDILPCEARGTVGLDLGLKDYATGSNGERLEAKRFYRQLEQKLGIAQRAGKKNRARAINAKIKNRRKDAIHKFTTALVLANAVIVVGDVSSSQLAKTSMAKSVLDAGWYTLKTQLKYKAVGRSVEYIEVSEKYTTQICSSCGVIPDSSPKGRAGLGVREWVCSGCGAVHDRDINAAKNILSRARI